MSDMIFEPFGESVPAGARKPEDEGALQISETGKRVYKVALISFWVIVALIVVARVTFHGNIFAFGG